jgi:hypothetical protein
MSALEDLAKMWSPDICRLSVTNEAGREIGSGTGFMTIHGLVTARHVLDAPAGLPVLVRRGDKEWKTSTTDIRGRITHESPESKYDYAVVSLKDVDMSFAHATSVIERPTLPPVGRQVAYLGYPFGSTSLVVSSGYVSAVEGASNGVTQLRIDGSVNRGNSGGPLLDLETGQLLAIVTRAETGFLVEQMKRLQEALRQNVQFLENLPSLMKIGGVDPMDVSRAAMVALLEVAVHLERSANVGIGYAFSVDPLAVTLI